MLKMSSAGFSGPLPPLFSEQIGLSKSLATDVERLAGKIGERNLGHYPQLMAAADFIEAEFLAAGYRPARQSFQAKGLKCDNFIVELKGAGAAAEIVVVGAHYDSNRGTPGADDNASGVASLLALARTLAKDAPARTIRLVAFVNEESPYFGTDTMGSLVYARSCLAKKENIVAMLSLETLGYYSDAEESQKYPLPLALIYPSKGDFIGFIGNVESVDLVKQSVTAFRKSTQFPSEGAALPDSIDGVGWSDHWAFWQQGYPALMVTDTAMFRNPHYHAASDMPEKLDYDRLARVVTGLVGTVRHLASHGEK